jgi:hypothetical protein
MSVRTWVTISALVLFILAVAFAFQLYGPVRPPAIVARVGTVRLEGTLVKACWPQRNGHATCVGAKRPRVTDRTVPATGTVRVVVAYPFKPKSGTIRITSRDGTTVVVTTALKEDIPYRLQPGTYTLEADAQYGGGTYVVYDFGLRVTSSGS